MNQTILDLLNNFEIETKIYPYPIGDTNFNSNNWRHAKVEFIYGYYGNKSGMSALEFENNHERLLGESEKIENAIAEYCDSPNFQEKWAALSKEDKQKMVMFSMKTYGEIRYEIGFNKLKELLWTPLPSFIPDSMGQFIERNEKSYQLKFLPLIEQRKLDLNVGMKTEDGSSPKGVRISKI